MQIGYLEVAQVDKEDSQQRSQVPSLFLTRTAFLEYCIFHVVFHILVKNHAL